MTAASGQQALANGRAITSGWSGMCQMYVRDPCWRVPSLYGSAIEAWNGAKHKHPGDRTPPKGAPCYYRGGSYGHAVISTGGGNVIRSTDCTYANDISEVDLSWVEQHWGYTYLGWTEDLNGVLLPLGEGDEDMALSEDDLEKIAARVNRTLGDWDASGDQDQDTDGDMADQRLRQIENVVRAIKEKVDRL